MDLPRGGRAGAEDSQNKDTQPAFCPPGAYSPKAKHTSQLGPAD